MSILGRVSCQVPRGGCTAVVGPNGADKTTLLMALLGEVPYQGQIHLLCRLERWMRPHRLCSATPDVRPGHALVVIEFLAMGSQRLPLWFGVRKAKRDQALASWRSVKAAHLAERRL